MQDNSSIQDANTDFPIDHYLYEAFFQQNKNEKKIKNRVPKSP
jgi:hypothetical protein